MGVGINLTLRAGVLVKGLTFSSGAGQQGANNFGGMGKEVM